MKALLCAVLLAATLGAAPPDPVKWTAEAVPAKPVKPGAKFAVKVVARLQDGWHLYGMRPVADGPIPTRVWLPEGQPFQLAATIQATRPQTMHDQSFNMEVDLYEGQATFTLPVRAARSAAGSRKLLVHASYQACDNKVCLPPKTVKLEVPVTVQ
jgi:thiol:disulfide interchange protein DsbD